MSIQEDQSTTQVESNDLSQADTESIPTDEPKEYTSEGDEILSQRTLRSEHWPHFQRIKLKATGVYKARCLYWDTPLHHILNHTCLLGNGSCKEVSKPFSFFFFSPITNHAVSRRRV